MNKYAFLENIKFLILILILNFLLIWCVGFISVSIDKKNIKNKNILTKSVVI